MLTPEAKGLFDRINAQLRATLELAQEHQATGPIHMLPEGTQSTESIMDALERVESIKSNTEQILSNMKDLQAMLRPPSS
jgi:hypothetical protein